jgi:predicted nucleic acid-binding protein
MTTGSASRRCRHVEEQRGFVKYLAWRVIDNDGELLVAAMSLQQKASISFWDALVVGAAAVGGCDRLYSEDLNGRQRFGSVEIVNPFTR